MFFNERLADALFQNYASNYTNMLHPITPQHEAGMTSNLLTIKSKRMNSTKTRVSKLVFTSFSIFVSKVRSILKIVLATAKLSGTCARLSWLQQSCREYVLDCPGYSKVVGNVCSISKNRFRV